jgi:hypothetical protein
MAGRRGGSATPTLPRATRPAQATFSNLKEIPNVLKSVRRSAKFLTPVPRIMTDPKLEEHFKNIEKLISHMTWTNESEHEGDESNLRKLISKVHAAFAEMERELAAIKNRKP